MAADSQILKNIKFNLRICGKINRNTIRGNHINMKKLVLILSVVLICGSAAFCQQKTYCNPINIDYGYSPIPNFSEWGRHRATADPVIVTYKGDYYLFSTNQWGYWWSPDMLNWNFISKNFCAPGMRAMMNSVRLPWVLSVIP